MTIEDKSRDEKLQYNINREAEKVSGLSSGKIRLYRNSTSWSNKSDKVKNYQNLLKIKEGNK